MHFDWQERSSCLSRPCLRSCRPLHPGSSALFAAAGSAAVTGLVWFTVWQVQLALAQLGCEWVTFPSAAVLQHRATRGHGTWGLGAPCLAVSFPGRSWVSCAGPRRYRQCSLTPWALTVLPNTVGTMAGLSSVPCDFLLHLCCKLCDSYRGVRVRRAVLTTRPSSALPRVKADVSQSPSSSSLTTASPHADKATVLGFRTALCLPFSLHQHRSLCPLESISTVPATELPGVGS